MLTIEEFAIIGAATLLFFLVIYAVLYAGFTYHRNRLEAMQAMLNSQEAQRRILMGNDLNTTIIRNGRG